MRDIDQTGGDIVGVARAGAIRIREAGPAVRLVVAKTYGKRPLRDLG